jgi:ATP-dependent RNA helicase DHX8/PRP22
MLSAEHVFAGGQGQGDGGGSRGGGRQPGNGLTSNRDGQQGGAPAAAALERLQALSRQCNSDHLLLLSLYQLWAGAGFSKEFCRSYGLDLRGMNFAREVRKQLAGGRGPAACGLGCACCLLCAAVLPAVG